MSEWEWDEDAAWRQLSVEHARRAMQAEEAEQFAGQHDDEDDATRRGWMERAERQLREAEAA